MLPIITRFNVTVIGRWSPISIRHRGRHFRPPVPNTFAGV